MSIIELISPKAREDINRVISKFPLDQKRSAILEGLHILQDQNGLFVMARVKSLKTQT